MSDVGQALLLWSHPRGNPSWVWKGGMAGKVGGDGVHRTANGGAVGGRVCPHERRGPSGPMRGQQGAGVPLGRVRPVWEGLAGGGGTSNNGVQGPEYNPRWEPDWPPLNRSLVLEGGSILILRR